MSMPSGAESLNAKRGDGDIMVSRTIRIPSGSIVITGTLTEADQIYRQLPKYLSQNGYKLAPPTRTATAPPGNLTSENQFLRDRIAHLEELLGDDTKHQRIQQLTRDLIEARAERNQWISDFSDLDAGVREVLATLEGGEAPRTIRETIAIQQIDNL